MKTCASFTSRFFVVATLLAGAAGVLFAQVDVHSGRIELIQGKPVVTALVNGKGPFRFLVDTGTGGQGIVTSELAEELALPVVGKVRLSDPSGQGVQRAPLVILQSLFVEGVEFNGVKAVVHELSNEDSSCQGLLGFALFRDYLLTLDFPNRELRLAVGSLVPDGERSVLPFRTVAGLPIVTLHAGGLQIDAHIDSGGMGLSLPEELAARLKFASDPQEFGYCSSLSTRFRFEAAKLGLDVQLGEYTFKQPFVEVNRAFPLANFGASAMQTFAVTFDQTNQLVRFAGRRKMIHLSATPMRTGLLNVQPQQPPARALVPVD
jgi:predicted aspartyl protease